MKSILSLFLAFMMICSMSANAGRTKGQITSVLVNHTSGPYVYLRVEGTTTGKKDCQTSAIWNYIFDGSTEAGKIMTSIALASHMSGKEVVVESSASTNCNLKSGFETTEYIYTNTDESII